MPARSARAARVRGPRKLPVSGAPYARAAAPRRSDAGGLGSPVGRSCFCLPRAARRDRGRRRTTISCLHERRCVAAGASTTRTGGRTSSGCGFRWGRLPIGETSSISCLRCHPCGIVGLPDGVGQWQGGVWGVFARAVGSLFRSLVYEYVHFSEKKDLSTPDRASAKHPSTSSLRVSGVV